MSIENEKDLQSLRRIGAIVANCLTKMGSSLEPGMKTRELDQIGSQFLAFYGAKSAPKITYQFPGATCISINEQVAHGIPGDRQIQAGDLVNIDVSAELDGYFADTGGSFIVPPVSPVKRNLCEATKRALRMAMKEARAGARLNRIGMAIEKEAARNGLTVIENLGSHGVGRALHEAPGFIPGFFDPSDTRVLKKNSVITIEPFLSTGARSAFEMADGWTLATSKRYLSAQYEHTLVITDSSPLVMTLPSKTI